MALQLFLLIFVNAVLASPWSAGSVIAVLPSETAESMPASSSHAAAHNVRPRYMSPSNATLSASGTAASASNNASGIVSPQYKLKGFDKCTEQGFDIQHIKDGFTEMIEMILNNPYNTDYPEVRWVSAAAIDFFGPAEKSTDWRDHIQENLNRAAAVTHNWWTNPFASELKTVCDDPLELCFCLKGKTIAYTILHQPYINFCPEYFKTKTLSNAVSDLDGRKTQQQYLDLYFNRASAWAHELMHIAEIGHPASQYGGIIDVPIQGWPNIPYNARIPRSNTPAYGTHFTKWLAQAEGSLSTEPVDNADNYALFMLSNYIESKKGFYPHKYQVPLDPTGAPTQLQGVNATDKSTPRGPNDPFDYAHYCYDAGDGDAGANAVAENSTSTSASSTASASATSTPTVCRDGAYADLSSCSANCYQGACNQNAGQPTVRCACASDPAPPLSSAPAPSPSVCAGGTYANFDNCASACYQGSCNENAGQPVTCICS